MNVSKRLQSIESNARLIGKYLHYHWNECPLDSDGDTVSINNCSCYGSRKVAELMKESRDLRFSIIDHIEKLEKQVEEMEARSGG